MISPGVSLASTNSDDHFHLLSGQVAVLQEDVRWMKSSPLWLGFQVWRWGTHCFSGGLRAVLRRCYWVLTGRLRTGLCDEADIRVITVSGLFDKGYYLDNGPDVAGYAGSAVEHFVRHGAAEGRRPNAWFDTTFYCREYPDVVVGRRNVFAHFIQYGISERRLPHRHFIYAKGRLVPDTVVRPAPLSVMEEAFELACQWYDERTPTVSIIILNWNKSELTRQCLTAVWRHTGGFRYEIIVLDNGSRAEELAALENIVGRFRLIRLPCNRFFGEGNNIAAEQALGSYIVFLNNDAFVTCNWLPPLIQVFQDCNDSGVVGPKFVYPDGRMQEAGAMLDSQGYAVQLGKFGDANDPRYRTQTSVHYVSAACSVIKLEIFKQVLGFDLMWDPGYYEDSDLCSKVAQLGLKTYYCPTSTVVHVENATSSDSTHGLKLNNIVSINRLKFVERWSGYLQGGDGPPPLGRIPFPAYLDGQKNRRRICLYTPYDLLPGGGEMYLLSVAAALSQHNLVTLVTPAAYSRLRLLTMGRELNLDLDQVHLRTLDQVSQDQPFDLCVAMGNEIVPSLKGLGRRNLYMCQFPFPIGVEEVARRRAFWDEYEAVIVNSAFTKGHALAAMEQFKLPSKLVHVMTPPVQLIDPPTKPKEALILGVGRFFAGGHCKRHDVMIQAFRRLIETTESDVQLHLAGALHPQPQHRDYLLHLQDLAGTLPVVFHLNISRADLIGLYRRALVYWHATGIDVDPIGEPEKCEHFGITVVEAMSAACIPIVPNRGGPAGIVRHGITGFHYGSEAELAAMTSPLVAERDLDWVRRLGAAAVSDAQVYSDKRFTQLWREINEAPAGLGFS